MRTYSDENTATEPKKHLVTLTLLLIALLAGLLACQPAQNTTDDPEPFSLPLSYPVGKKPATLATHDMNNDGYPDLLVPNSDDHNLMYFEGQGNGSFATPFIMKTGREPVDLSIQDFNQDGIPDIAVANYGDSNISIILGQKDGVFKKIAPVTLGTLRLPLAIDTGDFNNDKIPDLAVSLRFDKLVIFLGNGDGSFKLAETYMAAGNPADLIVGDFNGDNNDDLAICFNAIKINYIRLFFGNGDGTFKAPKKIKGAKQSTFITKADINQDNLTDLIIASPGFDSLTLFLGDGRGDFLKFGDFSAEKAPHHVVAGEFSGDNKTDLIVTNKRDASVTLLQGKGDGSFLYPHFNYAVGVGPSSMVAADFNKDGLVDIALILYEKSILEILIRQLGP